MCAVAAGSWGFLGCPASESGRLCREGGGSRTGRPLSKGAKVGFAPNLGDEPQKETCYSGADLA
jgi:hypothetical protein